MISISATHWQPIKAITVFVSDLIGPTLHGNRTDALAPVSSTWIVLLCLDAAIALFFIVLGHGAGRRGEAFALILFWGGIFLLLIPFVSRITRPILARAERLFILVLLGEFLLIYKIIYSPASFIRFDEMLHWASAYDILYRHKLFLSNPLLPISPSYPALEILTTSLANLGGMTIFPASILVTAALRGTFVVSLFLFFEKLTGVSRIAAIACLIYMGCSTFVIFDAMFAYESLGIVLVMIIMMAEIDVSRTRSIAGVVLIAILLAVLAATHHLSSFWCMLYLSGLVMVEVVRRDDIPLRTRLSVTGWVTALAIIFPVLWLYVIGSSITEYMGPALQIAVESVYEKLYGVSAPRGMLVGADGKVQPIGNRLIVMSGTLLLVIGLSTGFFRSLTLTDTMSRGWGRLAQVIRRKWRDSRVIAVSLGAFGFPLSVALRLTGGGWEIGNRLNTMVFISVGLVIAVSIVHYWQANIKRWNLILINVGIVIILSCGIIISAGPTPIRGSYTVGSDSDSIEYMGIQTARWTKEWLGEGNVIAADRVNRTLLSTEGQQNMTSTLSNSVEVSQIFFSDSFTPDTLYRILAGNLDYLYVDLRLSTARAVLGEYYDRGAESRSAGTPPSPRNLLKFDDNDNVSRVYDNGWIIIYDVRRFREIGK